MPLVAGVDCSTQSTKVVVCDADTGRVIRAGSAPHPEGTEVHPDVWEQALRSATANRLLDDVAGIAVAGQQHGMVTVDADGAVVRPALLWNDTRSAGAAKDLVVELGGGQAWAEAVGSVPVASFTVTKLRWLADNEPENADRVVDVMLPHDWLTWRLRGGAATGADPVTDRGDASGTGYWSPGENAYRHDLLELAFRRSPAVPRVLEPAEVAGQTGSGMIVGAGTGDNMGAALGLGARPGDVVVSLGTSGTVFAVTERSTADPTGIVAGFADATGRYLPLVCTLNAARVLDAVAQLLGTDHAGLARLALAAPPGAGGVVLLPYLDGERTPDLPNATGLLGGLTRDSMTPENLARAAVEGMLCGLADGVDALRSYGVEVRRVLLIGGASRSPSVAEVAPSVLGAPVTVPPPGEYVALGAARQAAWVVTGGKEPPEWDLEGRAVDRPDVDAVTAATIRGQYREIRNLVLPAGAAPPGMIT